MKGIFLGNDPGTIALVWPDSMRARLREWVDFPSEVLTTDSLPKYRSHLAETEVIFSTWSMPCLTPEELDMFPRLRAVFYAAGSVKSFADPLFDRGILVVSAWGANAIPVAEFTLGQIFFALKLGWLHHRTIRREGGPQGWRQLDVPGAFGATVGLVSLGMIGRCVAEMLRNFSLKIIAHDPFANEETFRQLRARRVDLDELFAAADVVSLHTPRLPETEGMITGKLLASMKRNATFINTSRGALVREDELIDVLRARPDLTAILDVTHPEPPVSGSPLYELENVVLTPHIAGSAGNELLRMADFMIEEFQRWRTNRPLRYTVSREQLARMG